MAGEVAIIDRVVEGIRIPVVALRIPRLRHNRIRANKPPHLRQIVARIHVDQPHVLRRVRPRVVVDVAGEAPVGDERVHVRSRPGAVVAEGVIAGQGVGNDAAGGVGHADYAA